MKVYDGSTVVGTTTSSSNGKMVIKVPAGKVYKVEITKAGKVTRFFTVNSKNIDIELLQGASEPFIKTSVSLFDKTTNVDYSFVESNPITDFYFDGKSTELAYNKSTADKMIKKVEELVALSDKTDGNNEVQYQAKMKEGEALATAGKYGDALTKFEQASMFKRDDKIAIKRMDDMDKLIKADKISQIDGEVAGGAYDNLIQAAKTLKGQKKYQLAIDKYEEALEVKRGDQFALDEIDDLMSLIQKEKREKESEASYASAMSTAEVLMKQKSYQAARDQYDIALKAKPADPTATTKKKEVLLLLEAAQGAIDKKKKFDAAIIAGDLLFKSEQWAEAKTKYDEALEIEAASTYAKGQNELIKKKLEDIENAKALKIQIDKLIAEGNTAFDFEKWEDAKLKFTEVKKLDDKNAIAIEKLAAIQAELEKMKQNADLEAKFKKLVDEGDLASKGLKYEEAIAKYTEAIALKASPEVEQKKADAETALNKLKNQKEQKANFDLAMKDGEALLVANKLEEARAKFTLASTIDETAQLPKDKIKLIDEKILANKSAAEKTEQYTAAMEAGNAFRTSGKLDEAILEYKKAQGIDKTKTDPATKIKEVEAEILALAASKSAEEKTAKYNTAMESANALRAAGKLNEAIAEYKVAQGIDNAKTEPATKIKEVEAEILALAASKSAEEKAGKYNAAMESANALRTAGKLEEAIAEYKKAQEIDKSKTEPATKIKEVEAEILALLASKSEEEKTGKYNAAMEAANSLRTAGKLNEAIAEYKKAQGIDNAKTEPTTKIKEVEAEILALAASKSAEEKEGKYKAAMESANSLRAAGKLDEAIAEYKKAQGIDNAKTEPAIKIQEVQDELLALNASKSAEEKAKNFNASMEKANDLRAAGKLNEAITEYTKAQGIDNTKPEPAVKIQEVQAELLALNASKSAEEKGEKFNAAMAQGNTLRAAGKLEEAIAEYQKAQAIDGTKTSPAIKIQEVQDEISALASSKSIEEKAAKFNAALEKGNTLRAAGKLEEAIAEYKKAQGIDSARPEPEIKIEEVQKEINALLAAKAIEEKSAKFKASMEKASALRTAGKLEEAIAEYKVAQSIDELKAEPALKIQEIQDEIASKATNPDDLAYADLMTSALALEESKDYQQALEKYQAASNLKQTEKKPKDKIIAIGLLIKAQELQAATDAKYNEAMRKGDAAMAEEDYLVAIKHFNEANTIKQNEVEPVEKAKKAEQLSKNKTSEEDALFEKMLLFAKQKIDEKDFVKAEELIKRAADNRSSDPRPGELQKELNRQIKNSKDYQTKMTNAKDAFDKKEYDQALKLYQEAKVLLPNETKPDEGIAAVKREKTLLENVVQEDEVFLSAIRDAEAAFAQKKYAVAIAEYKKAAARKPADKTIEPKIDEIQKIISDLANAANTQAKKANFDGIVAQADNLFESSKWVEAKAKYEEANSLIADNSHVLAQIQKCSTNIDSKKNKLDEYNNLIVAADTKFNQKQYQDAKDLYLKALKINNSDSYPHSQLGKIDGVLNPVFTDDGTLAALGIPVDNSLLEGQALLERAAKVRAHRSTNALRDKEKELDELGIERTDLKTYENQAISVELKNKIEVQELVEMDKDDWRQTVVDSVRFATKEIADLQDRNNVFETAEGQEAKRMVAGVTRENEEKYTIKHQVFAENTEKVKRSSIREEDLLIEKSANLYNQQLETKTTFTQIEIGVEENTMDDLKDRELVVDSVRNAQKLLSVSDFEQGQRMIEKSMDIKGEVVKSNVIRESKDIESDLRRHEIVAEVKVKNQQATKVEEDSYTELYDKSQNTRKVVTNKQESLEVENLEYQENQDLKIAKLVSTEKNVIDITSKNQDNDDLLRQRSKDLITTHVKEVEAIDNEGAKTPEKNQAVMKEEIQLTSERHQSAEEDQIQKNREARKFVEDIANQKMVFSEKAANEIGKNYPEGVSQESFQKNGNDGLPIAFITRRVVVIDGHGEVYVRTQSLSAITYSKNGEPSSEYVWQKETSNAKLTRNF